METLLMFAAFSGTGEHVPLSEPSPKFAAFDTIKLPAKTYRQEYRPGIGYVWVEESPRPFPVPPRQAGDTTPDTIAPLVADSNYRYGVPVRAMEPITTDARMTVRRGSTNCSTFG